MSESSSDVPPAAVPASAARAPAKRTRQSSPAKSSKHRTDEGETVTELIEPPQTSCAESQAEDALSSLPPELLAIIIRKLDTKSILTLHKTCRHLRNVVHTPGVVKKLDLSLSTLATVKTKLNFFHDISGHVKILNLSGVYDLDLSTLVRALEHMESLVNLDVSFTNVTIPDFLKFRKVRPTLKSLAINYSYDYEEDMRVSEEDVREAQQAFKGFRSVHFVYTGRDHRIFPVGKTAILMLFNTDVFRFTLTFVCGAFQSRYNEPPIDWNITGAIRVSQFQMHLLQDPSRRCMPILRFVEIDKCEIIVFIQCMCCNTQVLATPLVKKIICEHFAAEVGNLPESTTFSLLNTELKRQCKKRREMFLMFWHRERNQFEGEFCSELLLMFKEHYVFSVRSDALTQIPPGFKWHELTHVISPAQSSTELDYGDAFKKERDIKLDLSFDFDSVQFGEVNLEPPRLINNYDFLKKISHLSLTVSDCVHYDSDFFNNIFESCQCLVTFQIKKISFDPMLLRSVGKSKSLKNIYIQGELSGLRSAFAVVSECRTLECFVYMTGYEFIDTLPDAEELFTKCGSLYYVGILLEISPLDKRNAVITFYNEVKSTLGRDDLTVDIRDIMEHHYTPYMNVFNVYQLRPM